MNTLLKHSLVKGCLIVLLLTAGFWFTPFLLSACEWLLPSLSTRWGYVFLLYGTSRWMGSIGSLWIVWMLRSTRLHPIAGRSLLIKLIYLGIFITGIFWLLLYAVCADPTMWLQGDVSELLLYETLQQAQLFMGGLIAVNLVISWFGFQFAKVEWGRVTLQWIGDVELLGHWFGLLIESAFYLGVIVGVLYSVRGWRSCVWLRQKAYTWWGMVVFHAAVTYQKLQLDDPLPLMLKMLILGIFTVGLLSVLWRLKPIPDAA